MSAHHGPVELLVAAWPDPAAAGDALAELREAKKQHLIGIRQAATLVVDDEGKLRITDTKDMTAGRGAVVGGVLGAGLGLVTGGVGWLLLGGSAIGALAAKARDGGLPDVRLRELGERMTPNSSAIVAVVELRWVADVEREFAELGADIVREALEQDLLEQLDAGSAVAYSAGEDDGAAVAARVVVPAQRAAQATTEPVGEPVSTASGEDEK
ncbi:MAG TPA: DUF1269 domain-containing protein [Blastococcus sp.]|jgi:uncharacterized membrane protein|nr:DUF1269 domain-containing protein [Blastococcus sp.]